MSRRLGITAMITVAFLGLSCGGGGSQADCPPPVITSFTAARTLLTEGDSTTLTAVFSNANATLVPALGEVVSGKGMTVTPAETTTYTLVATNAVGVTLSASVTLTVVKPPSISAFSVPHDLITAGDTASATATFQDGSGSIDQGVGPVASGPVDLQPGATTRYTLTVTNAAGATATRALTLQVLPAPTVELHAGQTEPLVLTEGDGTVLTWKATQATHLALVTAPASLAAITQDLTSIMGKEQLPVTPSALTTYTYTLIASNDAPASTHGTVRSTATVTVVAAPVIHSFVASPPPYLQGGNVTFTADFDFGSGSLSRALAPDRKDLVFSRVGKSVPAFTDRYTLTVTNAAGTSHMSNIDLTVTPPTLLSLGEGGNLVVRKDGTVWTWREGTALVRVQGLSDIISVQAGHDRGLALDRAGRIWSWPLGSPRVDGPVLEDATALAGSGSHALALRADGTLWAWGANDRGQLGDGTRVDRLSPVQVLDADGRPLRDLVAAAAGEGHSLALTRSGRVLAWGADASSAESFPRPVMAGGAPLEDMRLVAAGMDRDLALGADGVLRTWGTASGLPSASAGQVTGLCALAAGASHGLALRQDGTVWTWGTQVSGAQGDGQVASTARAPFQMRGLPQIQAIAAREDATWMLSTEGELWACGRIGGATLPVPLRLLSLDRP